MNPCTGYQALAQDAAPAEHAYASFIAGRWAALQAEQLPMHYRTLVTHYETTPWAYKARQRLVSNMP